MCSHNDTLIHSTLPVEASISAQPNILYILRDRQYLSQIRIPDDAEVYNILVFQKVSELPSNLSNKKLNLYYIEDPEARHAVSEKISQLIASEHQIHETMRFLTEALFSNQGSQCILGRAHTLFNNPVFLVSIANETILVSCDEQDMAGRPALQQIVSQAKVGKLIPSSPMITEQLFDNELIRSMEQDPEQAIIPSYNKVLDVQQLTVPIQVKEISVGALTVLATSRYFEPLDRQILWRLASIIAQEMQKKSLFTRNSNEIQAQFLNHLISTQAVSSNYIHQMVEMRRLSKIKDKFYLMMLQSGEEFFSPDPNLFTNLLPQLQPILSHTFYLIRDSEMVMVFNLPDKVDIHRLVDEFLTPKCEKYHLIAGISNMYRDLTLTYQHYNQAKEAAALATHYQEVALNYFSDIAPKQLLRLAGKYDDLLSYCVPELLDLLHYDQENDTDLVTTLYVYLETFGKASTAAQLLFIHKNTLLYRIAKIKEILCCNLDKGEDIYKLMMSLRILRIIQLYDFPHDLEEKLR